MKSLELKIPPALVMLLCGLLMWLGKVSAPSLNLENPLRMLLSRALFAIGVLICFLAFMAFREARTTLNPLHPEQASKLVVSGILGWTRNPIYLGLSFVLLAWGIALNNGLSLFLVLLFPLFLTRFQIIPEEEHLRRVFGQDYVDYCKKVRRWV